MKDNNQIFNFSNKIMSSEDKIFLFKLKLIDAVKNNDQKMIAYYNEVINALESEDYKKRQQEIEEICKRNT